MEYKLIEEIVSRSVSNNWNDAKAEWIFHHAYYSVEPKICLCGHSPIVNICEIKNKVNNTITEVGNCCIKKFFGIEEGDIFFKALHRLTKNDCASVGIEVINRMYDKRLITLWEYIFYRDTVKKRDTSMSVKQSEMRWKINEKFLDWIIPIVEEEKLLESDELSSLLSQVYQEVKI